MAKKKKQRAPVNPELTKVKSVFQRNVDMAYKVQRTHKSDFVERYDLTDVYCKRRIKAVMNLLSKFKERYGKQYPELEMEEDLANIASLPVMTYDSIERSASLCLGVALWMLDRAWESETILEVSDLLPESYSGVDCVDVYDTRFHHSVFKKMLLVIQTRYGKDRSKYVVPESIFDKRDPEDAFHKIMALLPPERIELAVENLKQKFWEWADLYFAVLSPMVKELNRLDEAMDRLEDQMREYLDRKPKKPDFAALKDLTLMDDRPLIGRLSEEEQMIRQMEGLEEKRKKAEHRIYNLHFVSLSAGVHGKKQIAECVGDNFAEAFCNFHIDDPYEMCFAILYLLDQDDDYAWVYSFMTAVVCRAAAMLPWGLELYSEMDDGIWFQDNEWIEPKPFDPEWYETKYAGELYEDDDDPHDVSLAQLVYQYTGAVLPRDMNRFDGLKKELRAKGLKPSQVSTLCAMMNVIGEVSRQRFDFSKYADQDDWDAEEEAVTEDLASENEKLKAELAKLRKQAKEANYNLSRENRELKDRLEKMEAGAGELRQELADLREVVFHQQSGAEEEKAEESKISFPYHTSRRLVAFGGHDSWLREIKFKLPDVRFMSDDISSPEIIKRADVVWIQTNCIWHKSYNVIIELARKYNRRVRYFAYASATKCAEQVVEEEENAVK